jgi:hypothetical protein
LIALAMTATRSKQTAESEVTDLAPEIGRKLDAARERLAGQEAALGSAALAATLEQPGAVKRFVELQQEIRAGRQEVDRLAAAYRHAGGKDLEARAAARARAQDASLAVLQEHAQARAAAMGEVSDGLQAACLAFSRFLKSSASMLQSLPTATQMPESLVVHYGALIAAEIFKFSATELGRPGGFPGAKPYRVTDYQNPAETVPAVNVIRRANEQIVASLHEQIAADRAAQAEAIEEFNRRAAGSAPLAKAS